MNTANNRTNIHVNANVLYALFFVVVAIFDFEKQIFFMFMDYLRGKPALWSMSEIPFLKQQSANFAVVVVLTPQHLFFFHRLFTQIRFGAIKADYCRCYCVRSQTLAHKIGGNEFSSLRLWIRSQRTGHTQKKKTCTHHTKFKVK